MSNEENAVRVKFTPFNKETWDVASGDGTGFYVEQEGSDYFIFEYHNENEFNKAVTRFDGMINYTRLNEGEE